MERSGNKFESLVVNATFLKNAVSTYYLLLYWLYSADLTVLCPIFRFIFFLFHKKNWKKFMARNVF